VRNKKTGFGVLTAVRMSSEEQVPPNSRPKSKSSKKPAEAGRKISLLFDPEVGGDMFLRNLSISPS
jgi:hypothetical protein